MLGRELPHYSGYNILEWHGSLPPIPIDNNIPVFQRITNVERFALVFTGCNFFPQNKSVICSDGSYRNREHGNLRCLYLASIFIHSSSSY